MIILDDTIAAISTPLGSGGIGIVRISGTSALTIADKIFQGKHIPSKIPSHTIAYGNIIDPSNNVIIDEVLLTVMLSPKTYTVENIVEINCHGGLLMVRRILELVLRYGARLANPGEFTMRAFLNGRIDLVEAEAVIDIINSKTIESGNIAERQLNGDLSHVINDLKAEIINFTSYIEAYIDFPDEDIDEINIKHRLEDISNRLQSLIDTYNTGRFFREGLSVAITGRPNVGKSSLLNAFLNRDRAIVTEIPGTTRDTLEEMININGIPVRLIDTAGIRDSNNIIEKEGVRRSLETIKGSDIIIALFDGSCAFTPEDKEIIKISGSLENILYCINKSDLPQLLSDEIPSPIKISAKTGNGLQKLKDAIMSKVGQNRGGGTGIIITNIRHFLGIKEALASIQRALTLISTVPQAPIELLAIEIKNCAQYLAEIIGEITSDEILNNIFSEFCIGK